MMQLPKHKAETVNCWNYYNFQQTHAI